MRPVVGEILSLLNCCARRGPLKISDLPEPPRGLDPADYGRSLLDTNALPGLEPSLNGLFVAAPGRLVLLTVFALFMLW